MAVWKSGANVKPADHETKTNEAISNELPTPVEIDPKEERQFVCG